MDEYGKHIMVTSFPARDLQSDEEWNKLWHRWRRHVPKLQNGLLHTWLLDLEAGDDVPTAQDFHLLRLAATYVDLSRGGQDVEEPDELIRQGHLVFLDGLEAAIAESEEQFGSKSIAELQGVMDDPQLIAIARRLRGTEGGLQNVLRARFIQLIISAGASLDEAESCWGELERTLEFDDP